MSAIVRRNRPASCGSHMSPRSHIRHSGYKKLKWSSSSKSIRTTQMPSVDTEFTRSIARRSAARQKAVSGHANGNTHFERNASSAPRTLVPTDQSMVPFPFIGMQGHDSPFHPTFPLDKGEEFRFTFRLTRMRHRLHSLEEWGGMVRGVLEESKQQFQPLVECGKALMMMGSAKVEALASKDKDVEDYSSETDLSTSSCDIRVAKKRCRARRSSVGALLSNSWSHDGEVFPAERRAFKDAFHIRRRTHSLINFAPKVQSAFAEDTIWRVDGSSKPEGEDIHQQTVMHSCPGQDAAHLAAEILALVFLVSCLGIQAFLTIYDFLYNDPAIVSQ